MAVLQTDGSGIALTNNSGKELVRTTGSVLQVVSATNESQYTTSVTANFQATGLTASITPKSDTNKILIIAHFSANQENAPASGDGGYFTLYRDGVNLGNASHGMILVATNNAPMYTGASLTYLDSPNTTSTLDYRLYFKSKNGALVSAIVGSGNETRKASIVLLEIVA